MALETEKQKTISAAVLESLASPISAFLGVKEQLCSSSAASRGFVRPGWHVQTIPEPRWMCDRGFGQALQPLTPTAMGLMAPCRAAGQCWRCWAVTLEIIAAVGLLAVWVHCDKKQVREPAPDYLQWMQAAEMGPEGGFYHRNMIYLYLHSAKHNLCEAKKGPHAPLGETQFLYVLQADSCRSALKQYLRPVQLWKMF